MDGSLPISSGEGRLGASTAGYAWERALAYVSLIKPRSLSLVVITALAAILIATPTVPPLSLTLVALLGGGMAAAGANVLNCYFDRDIDAMMARTRGRVLPAGRVEPRRALALGITLTVGAPLVLGFGTNWLAAATALAANLFYIFVYTLWLKRRSPQNVVIGGLAGAASPLIGWLAVSPQLDPLPLLMMAIVYFWTPAHFWALALLTQEDYRRAGVPMLPVARGVAATRRQILVYAILTVAVSLGPSVIESVGALYTMAAIALGLVFIWVSWRVLRDPGEGWTRVLFRFSVFYLGLLCLALVLDRLLF